MNLISQIEEIKKKISGKILFDESLSKYSWFNLGGPAKIIFKPNNLNELSFFLKETKGSHKIKVLGVSKIEYLKILNIRKIINPYRKGFQYRIFISYYINGVRLIDNF